MSPRTPLFHPSKYFERGDRPSLSRAAGVVAANAVLSSVFLWWFFNSLVGKLDFPPRAASDVQEIVSGAAIGMFFSVFIGWIFLSVILHIVVWFADGKRGIGTTIAVVGISEFVGLVLFPLTIVGFFLWMGDVPVNPTMAQSVEYLQTVVSERSPLLFLLVLVGNLWRAYLQAIGLSCVHDISYTKIAVVTFVLAILGTISTLT